MRSAACVPARRNWVGPSKPPQQQAEALRGEEQKAHDELTRLTDAAAQGGLQDALALKLEREQALGARRSEYDDLTAKLRASDERRMQLERELDPLRQRITEFQLKEQAARLGFEQYAQLVDAQADLAAAEPSPSKTAMCAGRHAKRDRPPAPRDCRAGRRQPGRAGRTWRPRERKQFLDMQNVPT